MKKVIDMIKNLSNKQKMIAVITLAVIILSSGISLAYFTAKVAGNAQNVTAYTGTMHLIYDGTFDLNTDELVPGSSATINFTVTNTGTLPTSYEIDIDNVLNEFQNDELIYTLTSTNGGGHITDAVMLYQNGTLIPAVGIDPGVTQSYTLTLTLKETGEKQDYNKGKAFEGKIQINNLDQSDYLAAKVLVNSIHTETPDFTHGDPYNTYVQKTTASNKSVTNIYSNATGNKTIGSGYTFDETTGYYTLTDYKKTQKINEKYIGYYTCNNAAYRCTTMYQILEVDSTDSYEILAENQTVSLSSDGNKKIGSTYTFDEKTSLFTLNDAETDLSYSADYIGYYTCDNNTANNCKTLYKILEVDGTTVVKADKITRGAYYHDVVTTDVSSTLSSNNNRVVAKNYTVNPTTGTYTLTDINEGNVSYSEDYIGYYTCNSTAVSCSTMYRIVEVNGTNVIKYDKYVRNTSQYATKVNQYGNTTTSTIGKSGLYEATDDLGTSYYYRGEINNNYVSFAGKTWSIVRINGDGSIRLILSGNTGTSVKFNETNDNEKYAGYTYLNELNEETDSTIKQYLDNWYNVHLSYYTDVIKGDYCNDTNSTMDEDGNKIYNSLTRVTTGTPSLQCQTTDKSYGGKYNLKVGLLSADEMAMGGYGSTIYQTLTTNYLYTSSNAMTMSPGKFASQAYNIYGLSTRYLNTVATTTTQSVRPVINLKRDVKILGGNGTISSPYNIDSSVNESSLAHKIMSSDIKTSTPSTYEFALGEPSYNDYQIQISENQMVNINSNSSVKQVGQSYSFDSTKGVFRLNNYSNIMYSSDNIGQYSKSGSMADAVTRIYKINSIENGVLVNADIYTRVPTGSVTSNSGVYSITDDFGHSYYLRGIQNNNYVLFANKLWRIMRITSLGNIRIILENTVDSTVTFNENGQDHKFVGYTYDNLTNCTLSSPCISRYNEATNNFENETSSTNSTVKNYLEDWYKNNLRLYDKSISYDYYCNDTSINSNTETSYKYGAFGRFKILSHYYDPSNDRSSPSLKCSNTSLNYGGLYLLKIGLITTDEAALSGFMYDNSRFPTNSSYLFNEKLETNYWWTMTPAYSNQNSTEVREMRIDNSRNNYDSYYPVSYAHGIRPVINLKSDVTISSGDGTKDNPYVIE